MRSEVLKAVKMFMLVFWVVTPCELVDRNHCFGETYASIFRAEDGGSICLQVHTALHPT
jgi:hypothetical protein